VRRQAGRLPQAQEDLDSWLAGHRERVESADTTPLHPVLREFHDLIEIDPLVRMYQHQMIEQVSRTRSSRPAPAQRAQLLQMINVVRPRHLSTATKLAGPTDSCV
jgi:phosphatidylserine decarboxylase